MHDWALHTRGPPGPVQTFGSDLEGLWGQRPPPTIRLLINKTISFRTHVDGNGEHKKSFIGSTANNLSNLPLIKSLADIGKMGSNAKSKRENLVIHFFATGMCVYRRHSFGSLVCFYIKFASPPLYSCVLYSSSIATLQALAFYGVPTERECPFFFLSLSAFRYRDKG